MSNIKEQIRQEIERQLEYFKGKEDDTWDDCDNYTDEDAMWYQGHWKMCARLLAFIDSLPEEKPSEDLEDAANKYAILDEEGKWKDGGKYKGFIAGAEWMRKKDVEDMYMSDNRHFLKCYEQGKVDMKVQMMKDAVEGTIICYNDDTYAAESCCLDNKEHHHHSGDKVKIIIVKED